MIFSKGSKKIGVGFLTWGALGLILLFSAPVRAQVAGATLSGTVKDTSGAVIPQAQVSIKNVATGVNTTVSTDAAGFYSAPNLLPGTYEVSASAAGFSTQVQTGLTLTVGAEQVLNFALRVGQVTQTVQVTGEAPTVELASSSISAVVTANTVVELPLNGRDWTQLAALQPGVNGITLQRPSNAASPRGNFGFGIQMSISGTRPQLNNYRLDGISIVDYAGGSPGGVSGHAVGVDAVGEFSVLTSNSSAEYGRTAGGVVNAITRSGTNQIHGDAYEFIRNSSFDARNFFDGQIPPFRRNQFGASVGGPIQKDKMFFFADYEGLREALGNTNVDLVPSADARNGIVHNADGTTCTIGIASPGCALTNSAGTVGVDPLVKPFLAYYALPNAGLVAPGNTGLFDIATTQQTTGNFGTARIDRKISDKDSVFGTYFNDRSQNASPDPLNDVLIGNHSYRQAIVLEETHVFSPSLVNSVRFGFNRVASFISGNVAAINPVTNDPTVGSFPGLPGPQILVAGLADNSGGGIGPFTANLFTWNSFQGYDDAFLTKGVHSIKFGFAFERMQSNLYLPILPTGKWNFGSVTSFLTNQPTNFQGGLAFPERGIRQSLFGGYIQDDWRVRSNLTVNLGLRYEASTVPAEVHNQLENLPTYTSLPPGHLGSPYINNPTLRNFEPRMGFSWDPFHNGKTAVRGAFGMFDVPPLEYEFLQVQGHSFPAEEVSAANLAQGMFPTGAPNAAIAAGVPLSTLTYEGKEPNPHRNYVMIWNLNVQRQLSSSISLMLGYVGNRGVHMLNRSDDVNSVLPTFTPQGLLFPFPAGSGTTLNPNAGDIDGLYWGGDSFYDALEAQVTKRISHGFQIQGSYTWGKNIDTGSASNVGDPYVNSISSLFFFCKTCRRGLSDYNIAQNLVVNYIWDLPTPKNLGSIGSHVLGGWETGGIISAETGVPITPKIGGDPLGLNSTDTFAYPNRFTGPGCANAVNPDYRTTLNYVNVSCFGVPMASPAIAAQCTAFSAVPGSCKNLLGNAGRNSVTGPGLATWDFSLFKNNYVRKVSENFNVQFRAEFFNMLNRANFATPFHNTKIFDKNGDPVGGAGSIDQTSTTAREIQFALKVIW